MERFLAEVRSVMARHTEEKINFRGVGELRDQDMDVERFEDCTYEIVCSADYASAGTFDLSEADTARLVEFLQGGRSRVLSFEERV
jgi:hypothetical protein